MAFLGHIRFQFPDLSLNVGSFDFDLLLRLLLRLLLLFLFLPSRQKLEATSHEDDNKETGHRMSLQVREGRLGKGGDQSADEEGDAHDGGADACGSGVVDGLEVLAEGELLVLRLQSVATPLVAGRGDNACGPDHKGEHESLLREGLRLEDARHCHGNKTTSPAVEDIADNSWHVGLVQKGRLDLPAHALAEPVVGDRQHGGAEQEATDGSTQARAEGSEGHRHVDDLKNRELQHVGGEGRQEEVGDELEIHLLHGLRHSHPLHQEAVHQRLANCRQDRRHESCSCTLSAGSEDLAEEVWCCCCCRCHGGMVARQASCCPRRPGPR
mmetsp:Transcript_33946/g.76213  ORF Transcript_33946/g.76213 Transcript_33946/m.76213 type:complete len:326 (+) Transcript_33946:194-1171(+)